MKHASCGCTRQTGAEDVTNQRLITLIQAQSARFDHACTMLPSIPHKSVVLIDHSQATLFPLAPQSPHLERVEELRVHGEAIVPCCKGVRHACVVDLRRCEQRVNGVGHRRSDQTIPAPRKSDPLLKLTQLTSQCSFPTHVWSPTHRELPGQPCHPLLRRQEVIQRTNGDVAAGAQAAWCGEKCEYTLRWPVNLP